MKALLVFSLLFLFSGGVFALESYQSVEGFVVNYDGVTINADSRPNPFQSYGIVYTSVRVNVINIPEGIIEAKIVLDYNADFISRTELISGGNFGGIDIPRSFFGSERVGTFAEAFGSVVLSERNTFRIKTIFLSTVPDCNTVLNFVLFDSNDSVLFSQKVFFAPEKRPENSQPEYYSDVAILANLVEEQSNKILGLEKEIKEQKEAIENKLIFGMLELIALFFCVGLVMIIDWRCFNAKK